MSPLKTEIIRIIKQLPETASISDIMAELYFRTKVDRGLADARRSKMIPHEKVKKNFAKWLK